MNMESKLKNSQLIINNLKIIIKKIKQNYSYKFEKILQSIFFFLFLCDFFFLNSEL